MCKEGNKTPMDTAHDTLAIMRRQMRQVRQMRQMRRQMRQMHRNARELQDSLMMIPDAPYRRIREAPSCCAEVFPPHPRCIMASHTLFDAQSITWSAPRQRAFSPASTVACITHVPPLSGPSDAISRVHLGEDTRAPDGERVDERVEVSRHTMISASHTASLLR